MKNLLYLFIVFFSLTACSPEEETEVYTPTVPSAPTEPRGPFRRTVLFYISGENNLNRYIAKELQEIRQGSIGIGNNAVVVYIDDSNKKRSPYILWIKEGETKDSLTFENDPYSSDPEMMKRVLTHTSTYYPADEYGLVLWGHGSGWLTEDSVETSSSRRAYGVDNGQNSTTSNIGKWMNMHTLAKTLWEWKHLKFIFADCCQFQCVESAYELRNVTDYIIGSPAEIPGKGAPYDTVLRGLFEDAESFYKTLVDAYFDQVIKVTYSDYSGWNSFTYNSRTPLSVIKTSEAGNLAKATYEVLKTFLPTEDLDLTKKNLIYYRGDFSSSKYSVMYDMNDFIRTYTHGTTTGEAAYEQWKEQFDRTVIYRTNAQEGWMTNNEILPYVFQQKDGKPVVLTDERYGGMSMFVPQHRSGTKYLSYTERDVHYDGFNADIKKTGWYTAAQLSEFGW